MPPKKNEKTGGVNKYPEGDVRNGPCEEHINAALYWLRMGLDSNNGLPLRLNEECHPIIRKAIKAIEAQFTLKPKKKPPVKRVS
jgi:hypothetical protein